MDLQNQPGTSLNGFLLKNKIEPIADIATDSARGPHVSHCISCKDCHMDGGCYKSIFENEHICIMIIDMRSGQITEANLAAQKFYGYSLDEFLGLRIWDINTLNEEQARSAMAKAAVRQQNYFHFQHRLKNGEIRDVDVYSGPLPGCGEDLLYSMVYDVTERVTYMKQRDTLLTELGSEQARLKLSTEQLNKQRAEAEFAKWQVEARWLLLETVVDQMTAGVAIIQNDTKEIILTNRQMAEILGQPLFPIRNFFELWQCLSPKVESTTASTANNLLEAVMGGKEIRDHEIKLISNGRTRVTLVSNVPVRSKDGHLSATAIMFYDITEKKRVEAELRKHRCNLELLVAERTRELEITNNKLNQEISYRKRTQEALTEQSAVLEAFFLHAPYPVAILDRNFNIIRVNGEYAKAENCQMDHYAGRNYFELQPSIENAGIFKQVVSTGRPYKAYGKPFIHSEGVKYWDWTLVPVFGKSGEVELLIFSLLDVTRNKLSQEEIASLSQFREIVIDGADILLAVIDTEEKVVVWNQAAERITGFSREDMIGKSKPWRQLYPEGTTSMPAIEEMGKGVRLENYETTIRTRKGQSRTMCWNLRQLQNEEGLAIGTIILGRDISEQKAADEKIELYQQQLRKMGSQILLAEEKLRRNIAEQLHDGLGQLLAVSKIKLGVVKEQSQESNHAILDEVRSYIESAIDYTRTLTCELSPPVLYQFGLEAAIEWICEKIQTCHGIKCRMENDESLKPLGDDTKVLLFQIVRELMFNVIKHAHACNVTVNLRRVDDTIHVGVKDDGVGFDSGKTQGGGGFGLFNIRERLNQLQGNLEINSCPGRGTNVIVIAPLLELKKGNANGGENTSCR